MYSLNAMINVICTVYLYFTSSAASFASEFMFRYYISGFIMLLMSLVFVVGQMQVNFPSQ